MFQSKIFLIFVLLTGVGIGALARGAISDSTMEETAGKTTAVPATAQEAANRSSSSQSPILSGDGQELLIQVEYLQSELDIARQERSELQQQVESLTARLDRLAPSSQTSGRLSESKRRELTAARRGAGGLTLKALTEAGFDEREATLIKRQLDDLSMQRLYLRDQAMREGNLGKEDYRNELRRLNQAQANLEKDFGREAYERYLYAVGRPNSVSVQSVIENSPAYNAGLQIGDRILSYDGNPVYSPNEIRRNSAKGAAGEMVPVIVDRNGTQTDVYIPRGPLGIQMNSASIRPPDTP